MKKKRTPKTREEDNVCPECGSEWKGRYPVNDPARVCPFCGHGFEAKRRER
jgi:rRNA maturation endonuclease Nob1